MRRLFTSLVISLSIMASFAHAQSAGEGLLNASSFRPLPADVSYRIQILDNSEQYVSVSNELRQELTRRNIAVHDNGTLILTIEIRDEIGAWSSSEQPHIVEFKTSQSDSSDDETSLKFNLFSSDTGGILNQNTSGGTTIVTPSQYELIITIDQVDGGKRVWQGWATANLGHENSTSLVRKMIPAMVDSLGKSEKHKTFSLQ